MISGFEKIIKSIIQNEKYNYKFDSINSYINYIQSLPELKRMGIWILNSESSVSDIYDLFLELDEEDEFLVLFLLLSMIEVKINAFGFSSIISEYEEIYPSASAIARSYMLKRSIND